MVDLRRQLQRAGAISEGRLIDVAAAEPIITSLQRQQPAVATPAQPKRKAASTMAAQPRRIPQPRLIGGWCWPDGTDRLS